MKTQLIIAAMALTFSLSTYADNGMDHSKMDHSKMNHSEMTPAQMENMHKSMEANMLKIINTVDITERKKLFAAHKESMKAMKKSMQGKCAGMK